MNAIDTGTWLQASCSMSFNVGIPTPLVLMLRPRSGAAQWVASEDYRLSPAVPGVEFTDGFGNLCQRLVAPVGDFQVSTTARVMVRPEPQPNQLAPFIEIPNLPDEVLVYLLPSRYCEADRLGNLAHSIVADSAPGYAQVAAIVEWVRQNIRYTPGSSTYPVSAQEAMDRGEGVCRDLAQAAIGLSRALCIPTRLVVGYVLDLEPMDVHAWIEAYVGHHWYRFDPSTTITGPRIRIAYGRDAADVAIYNQYGPLLLPYDMRVAVNALDAPP
jgi:transglutaminase-like putative cysteine protease